MSMKPTLPEKGIDAAGENTYADVIAATARECSNISVSVSTEDAIVSLDGGTTEHIYVAADAAPFVLANVNIPAGSQIQGKNAGAGSNYANLIVHVW